MRLSPKPKSASTPWSNEAWKVTDCLQSWAGSAAHSRINHWSTFLITSSLAYAWAIAWSTVPSLARNLAVGAAPEPLYESTIHPTSDLDATGVTRRRPAANSYGMV